MDREYSTAGNFKIFIYKTHFLWSDMGKWGRQEQDNMYTTKSEGNRRLRNRSRRWGDNIKSAS